MCGLTGFLDFDRTMSGDAQAAVCTRMSNALAHRGPDDHGVWTDAATGIALGHRRLAILDLSPLGHQPMTSESGRYVISYNGEIYNYEALRGELEHHGFRGTSDTEVLLAAFEEWGFSEALPKLNGMFAVALWDRKDRALWLGRDRFGEKPLYFGRVGHALVFGSELKAVRTFPGFRADIDRGALTQFLRFGYVPTQACIFQGMRKLPPGSFHRIAREADIDAAPSRYWSVEAVAQEGIAQPFRGSDEDAIHELDFRLRRAVKLRMVSDVPLGAFLSGGIDSSTVVAMMQDGATHRVRTFTIGSDDTLINEARAAKRVAEYLGSDHTELYVNPADAQALIPRLPSLYDEPFADSSQIPTFLVSELARRQVTVALSGDGGDEIFGGYNWYFAAAARWRRFLGLPAPVRKMAARIGQLGRVPTLNHALVRLLQALPAETRARTPADLLPKLLDLATSNEPNELFMAFQSAWTAPGDVTGVMEPAHVVFQTAPPKLDDLRALMMCTDALAYLPDDILVKVDRAAMGVGLETRVPMLDPDVVRLAWSLPDHLKFAQGTGKWILREVLARHVPRTLFDGPKKGFAIPLAAWLRGPLREWAEAQLSVTRLRQDGFFEPSAVRRKWNEHLSGMRHSESSVWNVLMFQAWFSEWAGTEQKAA